MPPWQLITDLDGTQESPLIFAWLVHWTGSLVNTLLANALRKVKATVSPIYSWVVVFIAFNKFVVSVKGFWKLEVWKSGIKSLNLSAYADINLID